MLISVIEKEPHCRDVTNCVSCLKNLCLLKQYIMKTLHYVLAVTAGYDLSLNVGDFERGSLREVECQHNY